jgi:hypothetical protein
VANCIAQKLKLSTKDMLSLTSYSKVWVILYFLNESTLIIRIYSSLWKIKHWSLLAWVWKCLLNWTWGSRANKWQNTIPEIFLLIFCLINCLHTSQNVFHLLYLGELDHQVAGYNFLNVLLKLKVIIHALIIFKKCIHDSSSFFVTIMYTLWYHYHYN